MTDKKVAIQLKVISKETTVGSKVALCMLTTGDERREIMARNPIDWTDCMVCKGSARVLLRCSLHRTHCSIARHLLEVKTMTPFCRPRARLQLTVSELEEGRRVKNPTGAGGELRQRVKNLRRRHQNPSSMLARLLCACCPRQQVCRLMPSRKRMR